MRIRKLKLIDADKPGQGYRIISVSQEIETKERLASTTGQWPKADQTIHHELLQKAQAEFLRKALIVKGEHY